MSWEEQLLALLGAPITQQNISFLDSWQSLEGPGVLNQGNNPFALETSYYGGALSTLWNSQGVQMYPDLQTGLLNTRAFLQHGYQDIIAALKSGNPFSYNLSSSLKAWSNGAYSSISPSGASSGVPQSYDQSQQPGYLSKQVPSMHGIFGSDWIGNIEAGLASSAILLGAFLLVGLGGLWIVLSNDNAKSAIITTAKTAAVAVK